MIRNTVLIAIGIFTFSASIAMCLNPFGCAPVNLDECRAAAAKMPTDRGVSVALRDCQSKFVTRPADEMEKAKEARLRLHWKSIISDQGNGGFEKAVRLVGAPEAEGKSHPCLDLKGVKTNELCKWREWGSVTTMEVCKPIGARVYDAFGYLKYRAEFVESTGRINHWYPDPISTCDQPLVPE